jgi:predicted nucleic acid-binding protein
MSEHRVEPDPTHVVADPAVLAADLLVDGAAREALDHVRRHSWVDLVASDELLDETEILVAALADEDLAADHRDRLEADRLAVEQPPDDHPALASAYRGEAAHLLSYDERLRSAKAGLTLQPRVSVSVRPPDAFARLFDPESLYEATVGGSYPGPDADPRA